jgi:DNA phosphorothioation-associated putative methyltransferase
MTIGKKVFDDLYVHVAALDHLETEGHRQRIQACLDRMPDDARDSVNVVRLNLRTDRVSLMEYQDFDEVAFPELLRSWSFDSRNLGSPTYRVYSSSLNPPILHRKELLLPEADPRRGQWAEVTANAETLGLFDEPQSIGFRLNWERLIASKGYGLSGHQFQPLGNDTTADSQGESVEGVLVQRHLTALARNGLSAPIQLLFRHGMLPPGITFFDYGCGRGSDVGALVAEGIDSRGWDPHYAADQPIVEADVVNLGFVVNVIEDPAERVDALQRAFRLARRVMSVSAMLYGSEQPGKPYRDGFITSRNTFQKYFSQGELKDYIEHVLHQEAFMVAPGIAFVFADKELEQRFNAGRYRTTGIATRLLAARVRRVREPLLPRLRIQRPRAISKAEQQFALARPLLDRLWSQALDLGRLPEPDEVAAADEINQQVGSLGRAFRLLSLHYDQNLLVEASRTRTDDLRLYAATLQFAKRKAYRQLETRLQRDIRAFFGDYRAAQAAGLRLLMDAASPIKLLEACQDAATQGLGWLDEAHSLQLHISLVERLPVVLRAYVACGLLLWDSISEVQLVKIHIGSGKLTLLEFDDFDTNPLPRLRRRIKVNVRKQDQDVFEYESSGHASPLLYRKSRFLHEDMPGYAVQQAFDEALEQTGVLGDSPYGPEADELPRLLSARRFEVAGMQLRGCTTIPNLDEACGANFTYRSLIECGETQRRLGISNLPLNPASYNALFKLATQILDPLIDYFGGIRLTYGFCSAELGRHIQHRVAPELDQHAAHEVRRSGKPICERLGAACDFLVEDEDMKEVADWVIANLPFDRLYFYGRNRPLHVSVGPGTARLAYALVPTRSGKLVPRVYG